MAYGTDQLAELTVGQRIEFMRRHRGLSRTTLAALLGYSSEWLRKVEREGRPVERISTIFRLADILHVENVSSLIDDAYGRRLDVDRLRPSRTTMSAVRQALLRWQIPGERSTIDVDPVAVADQIVEMWSTWQTFSRCYSAMYQRLPALIDGIGAIHDHLLRAEALRLVSSFLLRVGDLQFAQVAIDRALTELGDCCDVPGSYLYIGQFSEVLLRSGSHQESWKLATDTAAQLRRCARGGEDLPVLVYLRLIAAEAAAAIRDYRGAIAALDEARELLCDSVFHGAEVVTMGPVAAEIIAMRVELTMGRPERALQLADGADGLHRLCLAGQSEYYLTLASAHLSNDDLVATTFALMQVERICTEEIRFGVGARRIIAGALAESTGRATVRRELCGLAKRAQIL